MTKRFRTFFFVLLAMLLVLSVFTACDDDDDDDSRACAEEDADIITAIAEACSDALYDDNYTYSYSGTTVTCTFSECTYTETTYFDESDISVTIKSGSTLKIAYDSSYTSGVMTYDIDATVDGTSRTLYLKCTVDEDEDDITFTTVKLDGVKLTGYDALYSAVRGLASRTLAVLQG